MKAKITFFPLGNADTTLIEVGGKYILWDYANTKTEDKDDKRCDLPAELNKRVNGDFDVVCFTHADKDHIHRMTEYFYLDHDKQYQTEGRKKMRDLWIPAAILVDDKSNNDNDDILRAEAKHRLKQGKGVKVFSKPEKLKDWLKGNGLDYEKVRHLIVDAGTLVPGWDKALQGIEFFAHAPFMGHVDDTTVIDRNNSGILAQIVFGNAVETQLILGADFHADTWTNIVKITRLHKNHHRLNWDIFHLSHHCSYTALSDEKGEEKTEPGSEIAWLYETQGKDKCIVVSPSWEIEFEDTDQPPHFQAYYYYKDVAHEKKGQIEVLMEFPTKKKPAPLEIVIDDKGAEIQRENATANVIVKKDQSPRVG